MGTMQRALGFALAIFMLIGSVGMPRGVVAARVMSSDPPRVFLLDADTLDTVKAAIAANGPTYMASYQNLIAAADKAMKNAPVSVVEKTQLPASGNKHDYLSLADYYWPDPSKPNGLPYINRDGQLNPEINTIPDKANFNKLVSSVNTLGLAYYFSGDEQYAKQGTRFLRTWFLDGATRMNPNLNYAQAIKGVNDGRGIGIIDVRGFAQLVDAIGFIEQSSAWAIADRAGIRDWFNQYLDWLLTSKNGQDEARAANNHGSWYDVQVAAIALFVERDDLARQVLQASMDTRIAAQIEPDGRQPLELTRTLSLHYSVFNLEALSDLATLGAHTDVDLWHAETPDGRSIRAALDFIVPIALGQQEWTYPQITKWNPKELSGPLLQAATGLSDRDYWDTARAIAGNDAASSLTNLLYLAP